MADEAQTEKHARDVDRSSSNAPAEAEYAEGSRLAVIMVSLLIGMFVVRTARCWNMSGGRF
jgi:hypothetical protein